MRFALLAVAAAISLGAPANAAVNVTINATAYGTFSTYCTIPSPACINPLSVTPISRSFSYTFQVPSVTDGASFSFNDYTPSIADPAFVSGTFKKQANGGYSGINFWYYQDNYVFGVTNYSAYDLRAATFSVDFPGNVPEPATWAMVIGGFGAIGGTMRYRRRKVTVAFG